MIDLKLVQKQPEVLAKALADRHSDLCVDQFLELDARRRALLTEVEELKSRRNAASGEVAACKREGRDATTLLQELGTLSERIKALDTETVTAKAAVEEWLMRVPNLPDASVPVGRDESENVEIARHGQPRVFDFPVQEHGELGTALGGLDFVRAARLTGSRFAILQGWAARLDRALVNFFLDQHTRHADYQEVCPPYMVNRSSMTGTGQLPKFEEDLFKLSDWDYYLIPTAEVPLTNLHASEVLNEADLPRGYCAATPCFRSEAGSAGKDTRGLIRMHQFTKVEMVRFAHPDDSFNQLEIMTGHARRLLELLELPYRVITLCTGDMARPKPMISKSGCPHRIPIGKSPPAPTARTFRPDAQTSATSPRGASPALCIPSTVPVCPQGAPWLPFWKTASKKTAVSSCPWPCGPTWGDWKSSSLARLGAKLPQPADTSKARQSGPYHCVACLLCECFQTHSKLPSSRNRAALRHRPPP